nr:MAG TPA: hypothetical protein [Caudoviricetes sp.]
MCHSNIQVRQSFFYCRTLSHTFFFIHFCPAASLVTPPHMSVCSDAKRVATTRCPRHSFSTGSAALPPL